MLKYVLVILSKVIQLVVCTETDI